VSMPASADRPGIVLDWRHNARVSPDPRPCTLCAGPTLLIGPAGRPCHKACAEQRISDYQAAAPTEAPTRLGDVLLAVLGAEHWRTTADRHGLHPHTAALPVTPTHQAPDASAAPTTRFPIQEDPPMTSMASRTRATDLLEAALAAAARGWHVFPLRPNDKRPAFPDHATAHCTGTDPRCRAAGEHVKWESRATTDPERITRAWSLAPYGIGIACGPSGLVVIDLDVPKPTEPVPPEWDAANVRDGADVLAAVCEQAGQPYPADTYTVRTGRGGTHLYFTTPEGSPLGNTGPDSPRRLGWLIDTRAHGGYVVGAGSTAAGRPYTVAHDTAPAALPPWLFQRLAPPPLPPQQPVRVSLGTGRRAAYLTAALQREAERVASATSAHNHTLYTAAVALGQLVAGGALTTEQVTSELEQAAAGHVAGPCRCTASEVRATIASGLAAGAKRPRSVAA
jgi:hypothetical protein